jgi:CrcB protein
MLSYLTHPVVLLTVGGAVGTNARYWLGVFVAHRCSNLLTDPFLRGPLAIFLINVSGSLLLGLFVVPLRERLPSWWIVLGVGFCGGYTTFSSFALDTVELIRKHHQPGMAILNVVASVMISCTVVWLAVAGMETVYPHPPAVMEVEDPETRMAP